jgi:hypothetical protein
MRGARYMMETAMIRKLVLTGVALALAGGTLAPTAAAQMERVYHPIYLPAEHNWQFRQQFPAVDRLFNAFDYGHGILYETLYARPNAPVSLLEEDIYHRLTRDILLNPPRMPMPEASFMPRYARAVPLATEMFEWAHILHRQTYDILAATRDEDRDAAMQELLEYYRTSPLAFTEVPKGMEIMDEQHFSKVFRERYPRFNGLIWAYHWLQVAVYEPLLLFDDPEERQVAMNATLARFWQMLEDPPATLPSEMPMTPAIAPMFTERYPEFAAIFDNLHMMHDVLSDILVSDRVPNKRREIYAQADHFRNPEFMAVSRDAWIDMALAHGLEAQGGPAVGFMPPVPTRDAPRHGGHEHHQHQAGHEQHQHQHQQHPEHAPTRPAPHQHHQHEAQQDAPHAQHGAMQMDAGMHRAMEFIVRLLADPQVDARIHADPELHRLWADPQVQRHLEMMRRMHGADAAGHDAHQHQPRSQPHRH